MTTNLVSALGFDILRDYIILERNIIKLFQSLNFNSQNNLIDSDFVPELKSYVFAANITMDVLDEQWDELFFSNSFYDAANKDITSRDHTFLNNAQKLHIQKVLNTRRLKIIYSIHRAMGLLKESQKETHLRALKSFGSSVIPFKASRHINQDYYPSSAPTVDLTAGYALESSAHHHSTQAAIRTPRWIPRLV